MVVVKRVGCRPFILHRSGTDFRVSYLAFRTLVGLRNMGRADIVHQQCGEPLILDTSLEKPKRLIGCWISRFTFDLPVKVNTLEMSEWYLDSASSYFGEWSWKWRRKKAAS